MIKEEVAEFIKLIKTYYPKFSDNKNTIEVWTKELRAYDYEDLKESLNNYLYEGREEPPVLAVLICGLKKKENKKSTDGLVSCNICGKWHDSVKASDLCYERCLRTKYYVKMALKMNINLTEFLGKRIEECSLEDLDRKYDLFIKEIVKKEKEESMLSDKEREGINLYWKHCISK